MLKAVLLCALACGTPASAMAGERDRPAVRDGKAALAREAQARALPPGRRAPAARPPAFVHLDYDGLAATAARAEAALSARDAPAASRFALAEPRALPAWHVAAELPELAARDGARAMRALLDPDRKPRHPGSALRTMLVLRLDGEEASPAFSVGGGGVAAALWRAVPGN